MGGLIISEEKIQFEIEKGGVGEGEEGRGNWDWDVK